MKHSILLWIVAFLLTVVAAYVQRVTGPTYPLSGVVHFNEVTVEYSLPRSHGGTSDASIEIATDDPAVRGFVEWKRFKTDDGWERTSLSRKNGMLVAELPLQPMAAKVQYRVALFRGNEVAVIPVEDALVMRFKGSVPLPILIPHILSMFAAMLLAARAGLEYFSKELNLKALTYWTIGLLVLGGFVLGPIVQRYAFGTWWTGWPLGSDLTDNKTGVALLVWIAVALTIRKVQKPQSWALAAAVITFVVFLIPHSLFGSELDYKTLKRQYTKPDTILVR